MHLHVNVLAEEYFFVSKPTVKESNITNLGSNTFFVSGLLFQSQ